LYSVTDPGDISGSRFRNASRKRRSSWVCCCTGASIFGLLLANQSGVFDVSVTTGGDGEGIEAEGGEAGCFFGEAFLPRHSHGTPPQNKQGTSCFGIWFSSRIESC